MAAKTQAKALLIFLNNRVVLEALDDAERGRLTLALLDYLEFGTVPAFSGALGMAFLILRRDVDQSVSRWEATCASRSAAGKQSAAARAAKKFADKVSCGDDCGDDDCSGTERRSTTLNAVEAPSSPFNGPEQSSTTFNAVEASSTPFNGAEQSSTEAAYSNTQSNTQSNSQSNSHSQSHSQSQSNLTADFERFWNSYPRKVGKQAARRAFEQAGIPVDRLLAALERQRGAPQWQRDNGRYIPNPATWLNEGRWEDETAAPPPWDCSRCGVECL